MINDMDKALTLMGRWEYSTQANGKDDKRNGQGTYTTADGNKYVGEWQNDNNADKALKLGEQSANGQEINT